MRLDLTRWARVSGVVAVVWMGLMTLTAQGFDPALHPGLASFSTNDLLADIRELSSDAYEGRGPGTPGEDRTVSFLESRFRQLGLQPGNPDGSYIQKVPMVGVRSTVSAAYTISGERTALQFPQDLVGWSGRYEPRVGVDRSEVVFVGYGVVAPEYGWDDYKGVDLKGKTLLMLVNDPPVADPANPGALDPKVFRGKAMTYYGRWTYKFEEAARRGAAAAILVHETGPAGYPWFVVVNSWSRENFDLAARTEVPISFASWMSLDRAKVFLKACGQDFDGLKRSALGRDFRPVALGASFSVEVTNVLRRIESRNVVAMLRGSDSVRRGEWVVYTAHWDHLGRDPRLEGDQIYNGATDNASGTSALLQLARGFTRVRPGPARSILFLAVTGEEQGLLGSRHYAGHPLYPLRSTLANINIDGVNTWGRRTDLPVVGVGQSSLEELARQAASFQSRTLLPEGSPEKGYYYRSDHFEFAKVGVPALYLDRNGLEYVGRPKDYGARKIAEFTERDYHKVSDEVKPDWDLAGALDDLAVYLHVGWRVANDAAWPAWSRESEFLKRRLEQLAQ